MKNLLRSFAIFAASLATGHAQLSLCPPQRGRELEAPSTSGVVMRFGVPDPEGFLAWEDGLWSVLGISYEEICADQASFSILDAQLVITGKGNIVGTARNDMPAEVWEVADQISICPLANTPEEICNFLDGKLIAKGTVSFTAHDNDFFGGGGRERAAGYVAKGILFGDEEDAYRYNVIVEQGAIKSLQLKAVKEGAGPTVSSKVALDSKAAPVKEQLESGSATVKGGLMSMAALLALWGQWV